MILVKDLIEWAKCNAIGRSATYPDGAIRSIDLLRLATDCVAVDPMTYNSPKGAIGGRDLLRLSTDCLDADYSMIYKPPKEDV